MDNDSHLAECDDVPVRCDVFGSSIPYRSRAVARNGSTTTATAGLPRGTLCVIVLFLAPLVLAACDTGLTGTADENQPPDTELSVQDTSLVDNIDEGDRLQSTVSASWSGTDPDGYVPAFEIRYWPARQPAPDDGWTRTTANDSLVLLPIPEGQENSNVVFQVRAIDQDSTRDPTPARTVFPIRNAPPTLRLVERELPPDTTFPVVSFAWEADDPEGAESLDRVEISLNDSTSFTPLAPEIDFVTFVASEIDRSSAATATTTAEVYAGESFQNTGKTVPGLRLNGDNTLYVRSVDQTDTTSTLVRYPSRPQDAWYVRKPQSQVLFVNDFRTSTASNIQAYHLPILNDYLPANSRADVWDLSYPTGDTRSALLPPAAEPTLRRTLALWDYIYWMTKDATSTIGEKNLPLAAGVMDLFFEQGGRLFVNVPANLVTATYEQQNPAVTLLPAAEVFPTDVDSLKPGSPGEGQRPRLTLPRNARVEPVRTVPGVGEKLPALQTRLPTKDVYPYKVGSNTIPLYAGNFRYENSNGNERPWPGPSTLASISQDRRVALLALPLIDAGFGTRNFEGVGGNEEAPKQAVRMMLRGLTFPNE
jgi:hypothetical protein